MRLGLVIALSAVTLTSASAQTGMHSHGSGPMHSHGTIDRALAQQHAQQIIWRMVTRGIVDASWRDLAPENAELKPRGAALEWVVTYRNESVSDPEKRAIYVFLSPAGEYIAANHSGR